MDERVTRAAHRSSKGVLALLASFAFAAGRGQATEKFAPLPPAERLATPTATATGTPAATCVMCLDAAQAYDLVLPGSNANPGESKTLDGLFITLGDVLTGLHAYARKVAAR
jgi:hypothetical protein